MPRRLFIKILIALGLSKFFPSLDTVQAAPSSARSYKNFSLDIEQLITSDPRTSRLLSFRSSELFNDIRIEYKPVGDENILSLRAESVLYDELWIYRCRLHDLKPEMIECDEFLVTFYQVFDFYYCLRHDVLLVCLFLSFECIIALTQVLCK